MKTIKNVSAIMILLVSTLVLLGWSSENESETDKAQNGIVLIKFKAQPEMGGQTVSELNNLIEKVKEEPNFVSIKLHVDPNDNTNILLYEEWEDLEYYNNEHMNTEHLQGFMSNSVNFLTGPPEISFWQVKRVFK